MALAAFRRRADALRQAGYRLGVQVYGNTVRPVLVGSHPHRILSLLTGESLGSDPDADIYEPALLLKAWLDRGRQEGRITSVRTDESEPSTTALRIHSGQPETTVAAQSRSATEYATPVALWPSAQVLLPERSPPQGQDLGTSPTHEPSVQEEESSVSEALPPAPLPIRLRTPGPPSRVRTRAQLLAAGQRALNTPPDRMGFPNLDLASFFLELEAADPLPPPTGAPLSSVDYEMVREAWSWELDRARTLSPATHGAVVDSLIIGFLRRYYRDHVGLADALLGEGTNCQGQTQALAAAFQQLRMPPPAGTEYAVQLFSDHIQLVLFDRQNRTVTNLIDGSVEHGVSGALFKPHALLAGALRARGVEISEEQFRQWLIAPPDPEALAASQGAGAFEGPERSQIEIDAGLQLPRASRGPIPLNAEMRTSGERGEEQLGTRGGRVRAGGRRAGDPPISASERFGPEASPDLASEGDQSLERAWRDSERDLIPDYVDPSSPLAAWVRQVRQLRRARSPAALDQMLARFSEGYFARVRAHLGPEVLAIAEDPRLLRGAGMRSMQLVYLSDLLNRCSTLDRLALLVASERRWNSLFTPRGQAHFNAICERARGPNPFERWLHALATRPHAMMALLGRMNPEERGTFLSRVSFALSRNEENQRYLRSFANFLLRASEVGTRPLDREGNEESSATEPERRGPGTWIEFEITDEAPPLLPRNSGRQEEQARSGQTEGRPDARSRSRPGSRVVVSLDTMTQMLQAVAEMGDTRPLRRWTPAMTQLILQRYRESEGQMMRYAMNVQLIADARGGGPYPDLCGRRGMQQDLAEYVYEVVRNPDGISSPMRGLSRRALELLTGGDWTGGCLPAAEMEANFQRLADALGRPRVNFDAPLE